MEGAMRNAIEKICRDLGLPAGDPYTQDWAYELPEEFRSIDHFSRYLSAYSTTGYGDAEKRLLMELMLDVANDLLGQEETLGYRAWEGLADLLEAEPELHRDQMEYWALPGEPLEDVFRITPLVRELYRKL